MGRLIFAALVVVGIILAAPLLLRQGGLGGVAGLLVALWAALMIYLIGLIWVRLKRGMGSSEAGMNARMAQYLAEAQKHQPAEDASNEVAANRGPAQEPTGEQNQHGEL